MAGVEEYSEAAQIEAVARLEAAIGAAGGVLVLKMVTSSIGRYPAYGGAQHVNGERGGRE